MCCCSCCVCHLNYLCLDVSCLCIFTSSLYNNPLTHSVHSWLSFFFTSGAIMPPLPDDLCCCKHRPQRLFTVMWFVFIICRLRSLLHEANLLLLSSPCSAPCKWIKAVKIWPLILPFELLMKDLMVCSIREILSLHLVDVCVLTFAALMHCAGALYFTLLVHSSSL